jgi:hypothetical protein
VKQFTRAKVVVNKDGIADFRRLIATGAQNLGYWVESEAKKEAPVRGGYRSFLTTKRTKAGREGRIPIGPNNGSVLIGGTLRRSIHSLVLIDGRPALSVKGSDENGRPLPQYQGRRGIEVIVGTNCTYGAYVELGTTKMRARPFLAPAWDAAIRNMQQFFPRR